MRKFLLFSVLTSLAALYSCTNEEDSLMSNQSYDKVVASVESDDLSRTAMNGTYVNWVKNDQIGIFFQDEEASKPYILEGNGGTTSGDFYYKDGLIEEGSVKTLAYYPYSADATYADEALNLSLKAEHEYSATSNNGFPMIATIAADSQDKIQFKNAGAILAVTVKNLPTDYQYVTLTAANNDSKIAGKAKITYNEQGLPILTIDTEDTNASSTIKIKLAENRTATIDECTFYFPLPVANYQELTFKLHKSETESIVGKTKALDAKRNMRYNATLLFDKVSTEITSEATSASDATNALKDGVTSVQVSVPATEENPTITLPAASSTEATTPVSLYFDKIESSTGITITEGNEGNAVSNVSISAPEGEGTNNVFNINLPNSTVTLGANGEEATYSKVTAATADETLIIASNVTVTTLKVKKGHVRVHGTIGNIAREGTENGDVTYIIKEENASIPESITDENIKVVSVAEWNLKKAIEEGDSHTLESDLTVNEALTIPNDKTFELNLANNTLNIEGSTIDNGLINNGKLTIKNGSIYFNGSTANGAAIRNNAQIQLDNVNVTSVTSAAFRNYGTNVQNLTNQSAENATITAVINGGTFTSNYCKTESHDTHRYAIHAYMLSNLTMNGSTVTGSGGVAVDVSFATLKNVKAEGTCTYGTHDLYVACGNATISDCTFSNIAAYSDDQYGKAVINGTIYENGTTGIGNIATTDALTNAFQKGGSYILTADITVDEALTLTSGTMVLDLDGKTLSINNASIADGLINNGELIVNNGTISFTGSEAYGSAVLNKAQIELKNVNITSNSTCFRNEGDDDVQNLSDKKAADATITAVIDGGTFNSTYCKTESHTKHRYAVHGMWLSNLTMNGTTISGSGGVAVDVSFATLKNVKAEGTCTYGTHDLYVACGNATVENCTFANAAAYSDTTYGNAVVNNHKYELDEGQTSTTQMIVFENN